MRTLLATVAVVGVVRLVAIPLDSALEFVCALLAAPLLVEALWAATDPPRSRLVRWWMASLAILLLADVSLALPGDAVRAVTLAVIATAASAAQIVALWSRRRETILVTERNTLWFYGVALTIFVMGAWKGTDLTFVPVILAGAAATVAAVLATSLGVPGTAGGALAAAGVYVLAIAEMNGTQSTLTDVSAILLSLAGQLLLTLAVVREEERQVDERQLIAVPEVEWDSDGTVLGAGAP